MDTEALIDALAHDATPARPGAVGRGLSAGLVVGGAAAAILAVAGLGVRADLGAAAATLSFWAKEAWALSLAGAGLRLTAQLARPDSQRLTGWWLILIPLAAISGPAGAELMQAAPARAGLISEPLWTCVPPILMLSVPIFLALTSALRRMAPTRLRAAGAAAGLAAGGLAATLYALGCQESSPIYLLTRYGLAIALATAAGALLGRRLLRW